MSLFEWQIQGNLSKIQFERAIEVCQFVCEKLPVNIAGWDGTGKPSFTRRHICFNGAATDVGQTFGIRIDGQGFHRCNTYDKPYTLSVRCCLIILSRYLNNFTFTDSGSEKDINTAIAYIDEFCVLQPVSSG